MKKVLKIFVSCVIVVSLCLTLTGCNMLDEMRASQGFWQKDATIKFRGAKYLPLPACNALDPNWSLDIMYVTQPDVPVLLSEIFGDMLDVSEDYTLLCVSTEENVITYCREDRYEEILSKITNGVECNTYCYEHIEYDETTWETNYSYRKFTKAENDAINQVFAKTKPQVMEFSASLDYNKALWVEKRSDDMLFYEDTFSIMEINDKYLIVIETKDDMSVYQVEKSLKPIFKEMFSKYYNEEFDEY